MPPQKSVFEHTTEFVNPCWQTQLHGCAKPHERRDKHRHCVFVASNYQKTCCDIKRLSSAFFRRVTRFYKPTRHREISMTFQNGQDASAIAVSMTSRRRMPLNVIEFWAVVRMSSADCKLGMSSAQRDMVAAAERRNLNIRPCRKQRRPARSSRRLRLQFGTTGG